MKKFLGLSAIVCGLSVGAWAEDFNGYIIDQACAAKKEMRGNVACATSCIKRGSPAVLVTDDGKIFAIADQDKVVPHAGQKVTITGKLENGSIKVDSIKM